MSRTLSVTEISQLIKECLENNALLRSVAVKGEISNFKAYPSGHAYFSLKDENSIISCVMWASYASNLKFTPKDGDEVIAIGSVTSYPARGNYQLSVKSLDPYGAGAELARLKELYEKLSKEGLFDESRKRPILKFPKRIGVIAGKGSAGMKDVVHNIELRWPLTTVISIPSLVQGKWAPEDLLRAFKLSQTLGLDTLIIGRGGGSSEDLGAFNDEALVRAVATSACPVISAVGHEIDTTLIDLVADKRVSTPTAAAVACVPDIEEIRQRLDDCLDTLQYSLKRKIDSLEREFLLLSKRSYFLSPGKIYEAKLDEIGAIGKRLSLAIGNILLNSESKLSALASRLKAVNPKSVLHRGFSITKSANGKLIKRKEDVEVGEKMTTIFEDGIIISRIEGKE